MDHAALESELVCPYVQFPSPLALIICRTYSWDLWAPSVWAGSYWTASLQYRALITGAHLGRKIGRAESASSFESQAKVILAYLQVNVLIPLSRSDVELKTHADILERGEGLYERDDRDERHRWRTLWYRRGAADRVSA